MGGLGGIVPSVGRNSSTVDSLRSHPVNYEESCCFDTTAHEKGLCSCAALMRFFNRSHRSTIYKYVTQDVFSLAFSWNAKSFSRASSLDQDIIPYSSNLIDRV